MAHPHGEHRQHKVERSRAHSMTRHYAAGGAVHSDEAEDKALVKKMVKPKSLKMHGGKVHDRSDRKHRAKGGRVKHSGKTNVNVIVAPSHGGMGASPPPMPGAGGPPPMAPRPVPVPAPAPMAGPPGAPPGMPPMGPHAHGGRAYKSGGAVKSGPGWTESEKNMTKVQHQDGKDDQKNIGRGKPITYKTGGAVYSPAKGKMGPKFDGGGGGGTARKEKAHRAAKVYAKAK